MQMTKKTIQGLAEECWHGVADAISWDEWVNEGQPEPSSIIKEYLQEAYMSGRADGAIDRLEKKVEEIKMKFNQLSLLDLIK